MRPTPQSLWAIAALLALGFVTLWFPQYIWYWGFGAALLSVAMCFDLVLALFSPSSLTIERKISDTLSLGVWHKVTLHVSNPAAQVEKVDLVDHCPISFETDQKPIQLLMNPDSEETVHYRVKPNERGLQDFDQTQVRRYSPWSFWTTNLMLGEPSDIRVFPNFSALTKYALRGAESMQAVAAAHLAQRRGEGLDFHQLREYRVGDTFRQIDWKATARAEKLISKEFQEERDQQVVFMLDTGRRMLARDQDLSHFDHVLNAVLLLGYVALRQGDAVGYITCDPDPRWMPPTKGRSTINTISRNLYDVQPQPVAVDYWKAATELAKRQKRRAMVILVTNIREEDSEELRKALALLRQKHLVVVASLMEDVISDILEKPVDEFDDALNYAATHAYLSDRKIAHQRIKKRGVYVHDTNCQELPAVLTEQYFAIKRAGTL